MQTGPVTSMESMMFTFDHGELSSSTDGLPSPGRKRARKSTVNPELPEDHEQHPPNANEQQQRQDFDFLVNPSMKPEVSSVTKDNSKCMHSFLIYFIAINSTNIKLLVAMKANFMKECDKKAQMVTSCIWMMPDITKHNCSPSVSICSLVIFDDYLEKFL